MRQRSRWRELNQGGRPDALLSGTGRILSIIGAGFGVAAGFALGQLSWPGAALPDVLFLGVPVLCAAAALVNRMGTRSLVLLLGALGCGYAVLWFLGLFLGLGGGGAVVLGLLPAAVLWLLAGLSGLPPARGGVVH